MIEDFSEIKFEEDVAEIKENDILLNNLGNNYFISIAKKNKISNNLMKSDDLNNTSKEFINSFRCENKDFLYENYENKSFLEFYYLLNLNYNVVLYGLGCKFKLLKLFTEKWLIDENHLTIYSFSDNISLKSIIKNFLNILNLPTYNEEKFLNQIQNINFKIFLVIHSLDCLFVKNEKMKDFIFNLITKSNNKICLIATVDHINSHLTFSIEEVQKLNLIYKHVPTFESYQIERAYLNQTKRDFTKSVLNLEYQDEILESTSYVYNCLTTNAKKVFVLILEYWISQYDKTKEKLTNNLDEGNGIILQDLTKMCMEEFLVNSEQALRFQLKEFVDHKLIKILKVDGIDVVKLLFNIDTAKKILKVINENE